MSHALTNRAVRIPVLLFLHALVFGGCITPSLSAADDLSIGALVPLTGDFAAAGGQFQRGMQLAEDEINSAGGVAGDRLTIIYEDSKILPTTSVAAARKLVELDRVSAVLALTLVEAKAAGPLLEAAHVPTIFLWDSNPKIDDLGQYLFSIGLWTPNAGIRVAEYSFHTLGLRRAVIVKNFDEWAIDVTDTFSSRFKELGGEVVLNETLDPHENDFRSVLLKVKKLKPDLIYAPLGFNAPTFFKQLRNMYHIPGVIFSSDNIRDDIILASEGALEGAYVTHGADPKTLEAKALLERFKARYKGESPTSLLFVSAGYDGVKLLAKAIAEGGRSGEAIKNSLYTVKGYHGASGRVEISPEGSSKLKATVFKVVNGKLEAQDK